MQFTIIWMKFYKTWVINLFVWMSKLVVHVIRLYIARLVCTLTKLGNSLIFHVVCFSSFFFIAGSKRTLHALGRCCHLWVVVITSPSYRNLNLMLCKNCYWIVENEFVTTDSYSKEILLTFIYFKKFKFILIFMLLLFYLMSEINILGVSIKLLLLVDF